MKIYKLILRCLTTIAYFFYTRKISLSWLLSKNLDRNDFEIDSSLKRIFINSLRISVSIIKHSFFLESFSTVKALKEECDAKFSLNDNDEVVICINGIETIIQTEEDIYILKEIYIEGIYNISMEEPVVVWDIGLNVGIASLYFANKKNVISIEAFEPFKDTFLQAQKNINLNPDLKSKIIVHNYGIGSSTRTEKLKYCYEWKGSMGLISQNSSIGTKLNNISIETIKLRSAVEVLTEIKLNYANPIIIAKIDCEGAEYEIIESLYDGNILQDILCFMIEWHKDNPEKLVNYLIEKGFLVFSFNPRSATNGMLYATKIKLITSNN